MATNPTSHLCVFLCDERSRECSRFIVSACVSTVKSSHYIHLCLVSVKNLDR